MSYQFVVYGYDVGHSALFFARTFTVRAFSFIIKGLVHIAWSVPDDLTSALAGWAFHISTVTNGLKCGICSLMR